MASTERKIPIDPRSTVRGPVSPRQTPSNRPVPYDTGKVKIGCMYQPKQVWTPSGDMERLQTALLNLSGPSYLDRCKARVLRLLRGVGS